MNSNTHNRRLRSAAILIIFLAALSVNGSERGRRGAVATVHPIASHAALAAFQAGGNAVDAAVAAGLTLGVVDGQNSGIGGGCFLSIRLANGALVAIDGRETAPRAASREMYLRNGQPDPALSRTGPLAVGVPGALAAYTYAARQYGKLPIEALLVEAAKIAEHGFEIDQDYFQRLQSVTNRLAQFPASRDIFLDEQGQAKPVGTLLKQPDLARTYRAVAAHGLDWFYGGPFAQVVGAWMTANGGVLRAEDFQNYRARPRNPVQTTYRGLQIVGFPPPSSGGVHVAQILNVLENFDLKSLGAGSPEAVHLIIEAMKLAFADRAYWLGDPDFANVPRGLVSKEYAARLASRIRVDRAWPVPEHSSPDDAETDVFGKHTTHFSTADAAGIWVACTATINTSFGSKVVVPGTGVVLNNEMDDFSAQPGAPNAFGLIGAEANAIAPGKRPLSSMSPTLVLRAGQPILAVGAAGGPTIISQTVLAIVNMVDFGMEVDDALRAPRFHHQWRPDVVRVERALGDELIASLEQRGHTIERVDSLGVSQAVARSGEALIGAHDPRINGAGLGW